jgi:hypothetical protein
MNDAAMKRTTELEMANPKTIKGTSIVVSLLYRN